jgi:hypothetical protein
MVRAAEPGASPPAVRVRAVDLLRESAEGRRRISGPIRLRDGRWTVKIRPVVDVVDGVPWEIRYENHPEAEIQDLLAEQFDPAEHVLRIPVLKVPDVVWDRWFPTDEMRDVAGIHFPHMVRQDESHLLFTSHDQVDGSGSRIEGTLLVPVTWSIDQAIIVRATSRREEVLERIEHERAHAVTAVTDLTEAIIGPQSWRPGSSSGRRAQVVWRWRYERVFGTWRHYRDGEKKLPMLRTFVTVLPPTRWSLYLLKPKSEIVPGDTLEFNFDVMGADARYAELRRHGQREVHRMLGGTTREIPRFRSGS